MQERGHHRPCTWKWVEDVGGSSEQPAWRVCSQKHGPLQVRDGKSSSLDGAEEPRARLHKASEAGRLGEVGTEDQGPGPLIQMFLIVCKYPLPTFNMQ